MKKFLSCLLCLVLFFSFSLSVFADDSINIVPLSYFWNSTPASEIQSTYGTTYLNNNGSFRIYPVYTSPIVSSTAAGTIPVYSTGSNGSFTYTGCTPIASSSAYASHGYNYYLTFPCEGVATGYYDVYGRNVVSGSKTNVNNVQISYPSYSNPSVVYSSSYSNNSDNTMSFNVSARSYYDLKFVVSLKGNSNTYYSFQAQLYFDFMPIYPNSGLISNTATRPFSGGGGSFRGGGAGRDYIVNPAGSVVSDKPLLNESDNTVYYGGDYVDYTSWSYNYYNNSYNVVIDDSTTVNITYGDENISYKEYDVNGDLVNNSIYYYGTSETVSSSSSSSSSSAPAGGGSSSSSVPAGSGSSSDSSNNNGDSGNGFWSALWDALVKLFGTVLGGIGDLVAQAFTVLIETVTTVFENLFTVLKSVTDFGGEFPQFIGQFFSFLPDEIVTLIVLMLTLSLVMIIIKFFVR